MSDDNSLTVYQPPNLESTIVYLNSGLQKIAVFVKNLQTSFHQSHDDISYIKTELLPSVEKAKEDFDEMKTCADKILQQVNNDLEESVNEVQRQSEIIKQMDSDLASLQTQLTAAESGVSDAKKQHEQKRKDLSNAEVALSTARRKLAEAENDQKAAVIGGAGTAAAGIITTLFFPPAGMFLAGYGVAQGFAALTVYETAKNECDHNVRTARMEVSWSEQSVQWARDTMEGIRSKLLELDRKRRLTHEEIERNQARKLNIQIKQTRIIELNESIKVFNQKLCHFHGTFRVLSHETRGGYSISMLKSPTLALCDSLSSLLQCPALCESCSKLQMIDMTQKLQQIEAVKWPAIAYPDNLNDL